MSLSINAQIELRQSQNELLELSNRPSLTAMEKRRFDSLLSRISLLKSGAISDEVRFAEVDQLAREYGIGRVETGAEARKRIEERTMMRKILTGPSSEYRSYSPLASASSPYVAQQFVDVLFEAQMSAGPLFAGSPAVSNVYCEEGNSGPAKLPTLDDTASTGFLVTPEGSVESDGVTSPSNVTFTLSRFSSGIILYSMELSQDVTEFDSFQNILASSLGKRLGRIQNSTFLASLLTTLGSNSSSSIASSTSGAIVDTDILGLVASVNAAYRKSSRAAFVMSSTTQLYLSKLVTSGGFPRFRHVLDSKPTLLDYPVYVSDFAASVATGNKPVLFGDFSAVYFRSIDGVSVKTFNERYIDQGSFAVLARKRSTMEYLIPSTSDSAIKYLTIT